MSNKATRTRKCYRSAAHKNRSKRGSLRNCAYRWIFKSDYGNSSPLAWFVVRQIHSPANSSRGREPDECRLRSPKGAKMCESQQPGRAFNWATRRAPPHRRKKGLCWVTTRQRPPVLLSPLSPKIAHPPRSPKSRWCDRSHQTTGLACVRACTWRREREAALVDSRKSFHKQYR